MSDLPDMLPLDLLLRLYGGEVARTWCRQLWATTFAHGSGLVMALGTPRDGKPGMTDSVYAAERILRALCRAGWLERCATATPSLEQKFFGVGGLSHRHMREEHRSPVEYGYAPVRACAALRAYVEGPSAETEVTVTKAAKRPRKRDPIMPKPIELPAAVETLSPRDRRILAAWLRPIVRRLRSADDNGGHGDPTLLRPAPSCGERPDGAKLARHVLAALESARWIDMQGDAKVGLVAWAGVYADAARAFVKAHSAPRKVRVKRIRLALFPAELGG